jgi:hypothetical protein
MAERQTLLVDVDVGVDVEDVRKGAITLKADIDGTAVSANKAVVQKRTMVKCMVMMTVSQ